MLHYMDDLDSKMEAMRAQFEREGDFDSAWTSYNPSLGRPLLNTKKFLEKGLSASREVDGSKPAEVAVPIEIEVQSASAQEGQPGEPSQSAASPVVEPPQSESVLEALQRKFASHKVTPTAKVN
jgi:hypothetical protein